MKMKPDDYLTLEVAIKPLDTPERRERYRNRQFRHGDRCLDLNKRYRWDLMHECGIKIGDGVGTQGLPLYGYLTDDHIDTALRNIVPNLIDDFADVKKPEPPHLGVVRDPWGLMKLD